MTKGTLYGKAPYWITTFAGVLGVFPIVWAAMPLDTTQQIGYQYNAMHPTITAATDPVYFPIEFRELLVWGVLRRAATKKEAVTGGAMIPQNFMSRVELRYREWYGKAEKHFLRKGGEKRIQVFNVRQMRNGYNSKTGPVPTTSI